MVSLFNIFVNNKNKPTSYSRTKAVSNHQEQKRREQQKKNWKANYQHKNSSLRVDPIGTAITNNAKKMQQIKNSSSGKGNSGGGSGSNSTSSGSNGGSNGSSSSSANSYEKKLRKKILSSISKMKDSNISFVKKYDYSDLWNNATVQKQHDTWILKEEVFLYTFHDKQKHQYINSLSIDCDKGDILGTCQVTFPYSQELMEYWIPGKTTFAILGGTFDREVLFVGRVGEINQRGDQIEMIGHNVGWKFKAYMSTKFEKSLEKMTVKNAVKMIFKELGFEKGRYHIDLSGIPGLNKYIVGEGCTIERNGQTVQNVPELRDVVKNLKSYNIDKYVAKKTETRDVQSVSDDYNNQIQMTSLDKVISADHYYIPSSLRKNYGVETSYDKKEEDLIYDPILKKIQGKSKLEDFLVKGYSGSGEYTYEDVLTNIASAIDAHFFIVDTTVCFMSFNALMANSNSLQKSVIPEIDFWQLMEDSYELDVNQYGYYNTVKIKYKNGTVTKSYDDLVKIYGEIAITYKEPKLDYEAAMLKAQAYLSAHIRDFGMELKATILHTGKIIPATFIKLKNPLTMSEGLFFVQGTAIQWSADNQTLINDLDLRFGPDNPDGLEVPETGTSYSQSTTSSGSSSGSVKGNVSASIEQAAQEMIQGAVTDDEKAEKIYQWFVDNLRYSLYYNSRHGVASTLKGTPSNCYDTCICAYQLFTAANIKCQFIHGTLRTSSSTYGHYWLKIFYKNKWCIADLGRGNKVGIGKYNGKLIGGKVEQKNY